MPKFEGCVEGRELAFTRKGANGTPAGGLTTVLVKKSAGDPANPQAEKTPMSEVDASKAAEKIIADATKAATTAVSSILAMNDVTKAHFLAMPDDAKTTFLAKSADDQKTEAETAKKAADDKIAAEDAAKAGKTAKEAELEKTVRDQGAEIADLRKAVDSGREERDLEKRAREEFGGFPGGDAKAIERLKSIGKLPEADRQPLYDLMKSQIEMGKMAGSHIGMTDVEIEKTAPATTKVNAEARKRAQADSKKSFEEHLVDIAQDRAWAPDIEAMRAEERAAN